MIPDRFIESLRGYKELGWEPGGFLTAVLSNDLREAVARGDAEALAALAALVRYIHAELPMGIWGSKDRVREHLASFWRKQG